jgi:hypothetical protein
MAHRLQAIDRPDVAPLAISGRLRGQLVYFSAAEGAPGRPALGAGEYFLPAAEVARILEDGVLELVSPLDTAHMTEVELTEEQEAMLEWLKVNGVEHVRVVD